MVFDATGYMISSAGSQKLLQLWIGLLILLLAPLLTCLVVGMNWSNRLIAGGSDATATSACAEYGGAVDVTANDIAPATEGLKTIVKPVIASPKIQQNVLRA